MCFYKDRLKRTTQAQKLENQPKHNDDSGERPNKSEKKKLP